MAEHDEDGVRAVLPVLSAPQPIALAEILEARNQPAPIRDKSLERCIEIHLEQEVVGVLVAGQVRLNHRRRMADHVFQPIEEQRVHVRQMACVLVR